MNFIRPFLVCSFFLVLFLLSTARREGQRCPSPCGPNECCSQFGYCGSTDEHCGRASNTNCDAPCGPGECCSSYGWCGTTWEHCGRQQPGGPQPQPAPQPQPQSGPQPSGSFESELLNFHNSKRTQYGLPPLRWNPQIASHAQAYVVQLAGRGCGTPDVHSSNDARSNVAGFGYVGENIMRCGGCNEGDAARISNNGWWEEVKKYRYGPITMDVMTQNLGHVTQMMWQSTTDLGCGKAACAQNEWFVVCQYGPGGNIMGQPPFSIDVAQRLDADFPNILP